MNSSLITIVVVILGFYSAWTIGANDVANAMGTSVGSKAISFKQAILIAAIFELAGALFVGNTVTGTIAKGIVSPAVTADLPVFIVGMISALLGSGLWVHIASRLGLPVSTTHSIVGAVLGFGVVTCGFESVNWGEVLRIVASWVISPLAGAIISFLLFTFLLRRVIATKNSVAEVKKVAPYLVFLVVVILVLSMFYKGLVGLHLNMPFPVALAWAVLAGVAAASISRIWIMRIKCAEDASFAHKMRHTERVFAILQIMTACYVAFAHGANDVANAIGPVAAVQEALKYGKLQETVAIPFSALALGGVGIVIGLARYGRFVMKTIGEGIMHLQPSRGFAAEFGCATSVLVCSKLGLPVSTTHCIIGAVIGVGLARGGGAINMRIVRSIFASWIWTIPFAAALTLIIFPIARFIFLR
jgi:PiT family inorganic phosphate transporter